MEAGPRNGTRIAAMPQDGTWGPAPTSRIVAFLRGGIDELTRGGFCPPGGRVQVVRSLRPLLAACTASPAAYDSDGHHGMDDRRYDARQTQLEGRQYGLEPKLLFDTRRAPTKLVSDAACNKIDYMHCSPAGCGDGDLWADHVGTRIPKDRADDIG